MAYLFLVLSLTLSFHLAAQEHLSDYCELQKGDTCRVLDGYKRVDARIYAFVDNTSCFVCSYNLQRLCDDLESANVELAIIMCGIDRDGALSALQNLQYKNATIIGDPHNVYKSAFKVKAFPVAIILDNNGIVQHLVRITDGPALKDVKKWILAKSAPTKADDRLKTIYQKTIRDSSGSSIAGGRNLVGFIMTDGRWLINNNFECSLLLVDSNGTIIRRLQPPSVKNQRCIASRHVVQSNTTTIMWYINTGFDLSSCLFEIDKDSLLSFAWLEIDTLFKRKINYTSIIAHPHYGTIIGIYYPSNPLLTYNDDILCFFDNLGRYRYSFLVADSILRTYRITSYMHPVMLWFEKMLIVFHAGKITYWRIDITGAKLIKSIILKLPHTFYLPHKDLPIPSPANTMIMAREYSRAQKLLYDTTHNWYLLSYENAYCYPCCPNDNFTETYLHIFKDDGTPLWHDDLRIPGRFFPLKFEHNHIYGVKQDTYGRLELVCYQLSLP